MRIGIINGPNLDLLGKREVAIYGAEDFVSYLARLHESFTEVDLSYFQSNVEGELIDALHEMAEISDGIILNGAGFTHTSIALGDAVAGLDVPVVEVHISNIHAREPFRLHSYSAPHTLGVISGFGLPGYKMALEYLINRIKNQ